METRRAGFSYVNSFLLSMISQLQMRGTSIARFAKRTFITETFFKCIQAAPSRLQTRPLKEALLSAFVVAVAAESAGQLVEI